LDFAVHRGYDHISDIEEFSDTIFILAEIDSGDTLLNFRKKYVALLFPNSGIRGIQYLIKAGIPLTESLAIVHDFS